jgi:phage gpG-like protein
MIDLNFSFKPTMAMSAKAFDKLGMDIRSFRVPLKRSIQEVIAPSINKTFLAHGRPETWTPYADDTVRMKMSDPKNKYGSNFILMRSGLLWSTMQQLNIWTITTTQAAILDLPEKIWYGALHQGGFGQSGSAMFAQLGGRFATPEEIKASGGKAFVHIPARPFAVLQDPQDLDGIAKVFDLWIAERIELGIGIKHWSGV